MLDLIVIVFSYPVDNNVCWIVFGVYIANCVFTNGGYLGVIFFFSWTDFHWC